MERSTAEHYETVSVCPKATCRTSTRTELQDDLRAFIRSIGPALGEVYFGADLDWAKIQEQSKLGLDETKKVK